MLRTILFQIQIEKTIERLLIRGKDLTLSILLLIIAYSPESFWIWVVVYSILSVKG
jgi:hypothetical protein